MVDVTYEGTAEEISAEPAEDTGSMATMEEVLQVMKGAGARIAR